MSGESTETIVTEILNIYSEVSQHCVVRHKMRLHVTTKELQTPWCTGKTDWCWKASIADEGR